jgi:predicted CopG family antitoxin
MQKKLTITIDEQVYEGLYSVVGAGRISKFIEKLVRAHVLRSELDQAYAEMAEDHARETEAFEWTESLITDSEDETR